MYRRCTTEKTAAQQRLLSDTLLRAMGHQRYDGISVTQLCDAAGLSRKVFYRLFETKDDVLYALIDRALMDYVRTTEPSNGGFLAEISQFLLFWQDRKPLLDALFQSGKISLLPLRMITLGMEHREETCRWIGLDQGQAWEGALVFLISGLMGVMLCWYESGCRRPVTELSAQIAGLTRSPYWNQFGAMGKSAADNTGGL